MDPKGRNHGREWNRRGDGTAGVACLHVGAFVGKRCDLGVAGTTVLISTGGSWRVHVPQQRRRSIAVQDGRTPRRARNRRPFLFLNFRTELRPEWQAGRPPPTRVRKRSLAELHCKCATAIYHYRLTRACITHLSDHLCCDLGSLELASLVVAVRIDRHAI